MAFFARRPNGVTGGEDEAAEAPPGAAQLVPQSAMVDQLARKMFGIGVSDINAAGERIGTLLAAYSAQLNRIESQNVEIIAQQNEILARLTYLAERQRPLPSEITIGAKHD